MKDNRVQISLIGKILEFLRIRNKDEENEKDPRRDRRRDDKISASLNAFSGLSTQFPSIFRNPMKEVYVLC